MGVSDICWYCGCTIVQAERLIAFCDRVAVGLNTRTDYMRALSMLLYKQALHGTLADVLASAQTAEMLVERITQEDDDNDKRGEQYVEAWLRWTYETIRAELMARGAN